MMRRFLEWFTTTFLKPPRIIKSRDDKSPYLARYYLFGGPKHAEVFDAFGNTIEGMEWKRTPITIVLHKFHRGDDDQALHNHPFKWSWSFVLAGGYFEERRVLYKGDHSIERYPVWPFRFNRIDADTFHRVDLIEQDAWTLFVMGPRTQSWGFWDRYTGVTTPWREFLAAKVAK